MTWHTVGDFALWTGAIFVLLLVIMFCVAGVIALFEGAVDRAARTRSHIDAKFAEERATRKTQNGELRSRINKLETAIRELNPGLDI